MSKDLGFFNEHLVKRALEKLGHIVELSEDQYDMKKDMLVDGKEAEAKLQTAYYKFTAPGIEEQKAFTLPINQNEYKTYTNQLSKCLNVERLFFTQIPIKEETIKIYEAPPLGKRYFTVARNKHDRRYVAGLLIKDMKLIYEYENKDLVEYVRSNGTSRFE